MIAAALLSLVAHAGSVEIGTAVGVSTTVADALPASGGSLAFDLYPVKWGGLRLSASGRPLQREADLDAWGVGPGVLAPLAWVDSNLAATAEALPLYLDRETWYLRAGGFAGLCKAQLTGDAEAYAAVGWDLDPAEAASDAAGFVYGGTLDGGRDRLGARLRFTLVDVNYSSYGVPVGMDDFQYEMFNEGLGAEPPYKVHHDRRALQEISLELVFWPVHSRLSTSQQRMAERAAYEREAAAEDAEDKRLKEEEKARKAAEKLAALQAEQARLEQERLADQAAAEAAVETAGAPEPTAAATLVATGRVAVLELAGSLSMEERAVLADAIRGGVVRSLPREVAVMTKENMEVMLEDNGIDPSCISEGACEVETARNLGVDYVVSGSVTEFGEVLVLSVKMHDVASGRLLAQQNIQSASTIDLLNAIDPAVQSLLADQ